MAVSSLSAQLCNPYMATLKCKTIQTGGSCNIVQHAEVLPKHVETLQISAGQTRQPWAASLRQSLALHRYVAEILHRPVQEFKPGPVARPAHSHCNSANFMLHTMEFRYWPHIGLRWLLATITEPIFCPGATPPHGSAPDCRQCPRRPRKTEDCRRQGSLDSLPFCRFGRGGPY